MTRPSRRDLLCALGSVAALGVAGCASGDATPRYQLSAGNVPGTLAERFRWEPRGPFPGADRALMDRLVAAGTLSTVGFALYPAKGTEGPTYVERDGAYYEVAIERTGTVERERPILWFDLLEGNPPDDAEVFASSLGTGEATDLEAAYGLPERDAQIVRDAAGELPRGGSFRDPEDDPPGERGHVFLRRGPDQTALLPDPPFTHVAFETNDGTRYARVVVERATVELRRYDHRTTKVADSAEGYREHVRDRHLEATFTRGELPEKQREILGAITAGGGRYEERAPVSDAMVTVLERLGLTGVETPEPKMTAFSEEAYFRYDGGYYAAELQIFR